MDSSQFLDRIRMGVNSTVDMSRLSQWMIKNTMHPKKTGVPWGFDDHEFQIALIDETAAHMVCRKCSQVGVSEIVLRIALGLVNILPQHTAIYTLPTTGFASKFAKSRIEPVIAASKVLSAALDPNIDNVELKKIGSSFLYLLGTFTQTGAISVPADILIHDEVDFSDPQAMTTFASRLGHAEGGGIKREFSTPTVEGYGISKTFAGSSQAYRGVRCRSCSDMVFPNFMDDVVIQGFDDSLYDIDKEDLNNDAYKFENAWLSCPNCHNELTTDNLANPEEREWVHKYPDKVIKGYQVFSFDVIKYNPIAKTLSHLSDYSVKADWVNFKVGLPDEDASSSFSKEIMDSRTIGTVVLPAEHAASQTIMGIDIGKVSWVIIGKKVDKKIIILYAEKIRQTSDGHLLKRVLELAKFYGVVKGVMDAAPDFTTSSAFVSSSWMGRFYANYYVRNKTTSSLSHIAIDEEEGIVKTARSVSFDLLVKLVNSGRCEFPRTKETNVLKKHLRNIKRVKGANSMGDETINWVSIGDDHYAHALNYLNIAATLLGVKSTSTVVGVLPHMSTSHLKTKTDNMQVGL